MLEEVAVREALVQANKDLTEKGASMAEVMEVMGEFNRDTKKYEQAEVLSRLADRVDNFTTGQSVKITRVSRSDG